MTAQMRFTRINNRVSSCLMTVDGQVFIGFGDTNQEAREDAYGRYIQITHLIEE